MKRKDSREILLNPGLHYILEEDDICYYIGFTREEYSKVRETPPSAVRTAIWQMCANVGLLAISIAGINAEQLGVEPGAESPAGEEGEKESIDGGYVEEEEEEEEEEEREEKSEMEKVLSCVSHSAVRFQLGGASEDEGVEPPSSCLISQDPSTSDLPSSAAMYSIVKRGLKLLRFHSKMDCHANPVVKVHFCNTTPILTPEEQGSTFDLRPLKHDDMRLVEEGHGGLKPPLNPILVTPPTHILVTPPTSRPRRRSLRRSVSESSLSGIMAEIMAESPTKNKGVMYSSQLSLVGSKGDNLSRVDSHTHLFPPLAKVIRRMSSWNAHRPSVGAVVDFGGSEEVSCESSFIAELVCSLHYIYNLIPNLKQLLNTVEPL